jgi:hypothetical protein
MSDLPDIAALSMQVGQTLITAMATDAWSGIRNAFIRVWKNGNGSELNQVEKRLDLDKETFEQAIAAQASGLQARLISQWSTRVEDLVTAHPEALREIGEFIAQYRNDAKTAINNVRITAKADRKGKNIVAGIGDIHISDKGSQS